jgi:hypothetical protein
MLKFKFQTKILTRIPRRGVMSLKTSTSVVLWLSCSLLCVTLVTAQDLPRKVTYQRDGSGKPFAQDSVAAPAREVGPGTKVVATPLDSPPTLTPEQARIVAEEFAEADRTGPVQPLHAAPLASPEQRGPEARLPSTEAPNTFTIYRDTVLQASALSGGYANSSYVMEPSTGINGKNEFQTGNWYASYSYNANAAAPVWHYLNPFTIFGSGFCCDQVTLYDAEWDRQFWLMQMGGTLVLANAPSTNLTSWCHYNINSTWFGEPSTTAIDYNDIAVTKNYLFIASNLFPAGQGGHAGVLRLPISSLISCAGFNYNYWDDTSRFTFKPVSGATNVMYWGTNWGGTNGSTFRVYSWADNSGTIFWHDYTIAAFNFEYRSGGQNCGSADGVVTSWCNYNDSRVKGGYLANGTLGFSFDATQGSGFPFPYIKRVYFNPATNTYLGYANLYGTWAAFQYGTFSPNANGDIGGAFAFGGGTGTTHYYPGTGYLIDDDFTPNQPWSEAYQIYGAGNTCAYSGVLRWGDYLTTRPDSPAGYAWVGTGWAIKGGDCGTANAYSEPHSVVFGRGRDSSGVTRWSTK